MAALTQAVPLAVALLFTYLRLRDIAAAEATGRRDDDWWWTP